MAKIQRKPDDNIFGAFLWGGNQGQILSALDGVLTSVGNDPRRSLRPAKSIGANPSYGAPLSMDGDAGGIGLYAFVKGSQSESSSEGSSDADC